MLHHDNADFEVTTPLHRPMQAQLYRQSDFWYFRREVETCYRLFGLSSKTASLLLREGSLHLALRGALRADEHLFRRKLAATKVERPLFIIGHPRSGTTFLHRLMLGGDDMVAFKAWQLFWPALTGRPAGRRIMALMKRFGKTEIVGEDTGHKIDLDAYDEEEFLFYLHYATPIKTAGMLGLDTAEYPEIDNPDSLTRVERRRALDYLDGCFRRQIIDTGQRQIVAQMHFSTMRLRALLDYYPDARFVYLVRDPLQTIPSMLSLMLNIIDKRWGLDQIGAEAIERFKARRYRASLALYRYFYDLETSGDLPKDRVMVLPYMDLAQDVRATMDRVRAFSGIDFSAKLEAHIDAAALRQSGYSRAHNVSSLESLGIEPARVLRDFAFVYGHYDITPGDMKGVTAGR